MSGAAAGKFQDHYVVLGIEPQADQETIDRAYALFAEKYGPDNIDDADPEKLAMVELAREVLSDPALRKEFDKLKGLDRIGPPKFSGRAFFERRGREAGLRMALLSVLYDRRRAFPYSPSLSNRYTEGMMNASNEELAFALWYLKQRSLVSTDDKSNLLITIEGMEYLEQNWPSADVVMPLIKPSAVSEPAPEEAPPQAAAAAPEAEAPETAGQPAIETGQESTPPPAKISRTGARIMSLLRTHVAPGESS